MVVETLSSKNIQEFKILLEEAKEVAEYRVDFYRCYDNKSFLYKYFQRKLVRLLKISDYYIGYIWTGIPSKKSLQIIDMYIKEDYLKYFNDKIFGIFSNSLITYEGIENEYALKLIRTLNMNRIRLTNLMKLDKKFNFTKRKTNAVFFKFVKGRDEELRCALQNEIFKEESRVPLKVEDIKYDTKQEYYIDDLCIFMKVGNEVIGYGQIIYNRGIYSVVNFGIIAKYRAQGYGEDLIVALIELAKKKNIEDLYIRVDYNNIPAKKLYLNVGFKELCNFSSWLWSKELS